MQDSLLATPLILDLTILTELLTRVQYRNSPNKDFAPLYPVLSLLSYMLKAPLVKPGKRFPVVGNRSRELNTSTAGCDVINSLGRQRNALEAFLKACIGLEGSSDLLLETRVW
jgi:myo-inositol-1-phosphate synthase